MTPEAIYWPYLEFVPHSRFIWIPSPMKVSRVDIRDIISVSIEYRKPQESWEVEEEQGQLNAKRKEPQKSWDITVDLRSSTFHPTIILSYNSVLHVDAVIRHIERAQEHLQFKPGSEGSILCVNDLKRLTLSSSSSSTSAGEVNTTTTETM